MGSSSELKKLNGDDCVLEMFGFYRDKPHIMLYIRDLKDGLEKLSDWYGVNEGYSDAFTDDDSDLEYFLDGDSLSDHRRIDRESESANNNLGEYAEYANLISGNYSDFTFMKVDGQFEEADQIGDDKKLEEVVYSSDEENAIEFP
ncbi:hypothetical protein ZIOFF_043517 [Zingiber officinale]|uniref:Uncharacterized protein n=1 Tax=Zingiber officinale TaxID=94328 RepID=A0A8J5FXG6_ZINOF|nr:hypothetical protein ZIOFF_043517 [Zingiber officinale]